MNLTEIDVIYGSGLDFHGVRAYRWRAESHCTLWHIDGVYDTVAEVKRSKWVAALTAAEPKESRGRFEMHHYMIYLDSSGSYEIIAASWSLLSDTLGPAR
jgi:hypothetical protein